MEFNFLFLTILSFLQFCYYEFIINHLFKGKVMNFKFRLFNTAVMSFLLSMMMTLWVTWINLGFVENFFFFWLKAWALAFPAAFVCVMILAQPVMKFSKKVFKIED